MVKVREINKNRVFWLGMVLCTAYQSYRYPLQISSAGTSPTYSDTPLAWQAGKFALAFPLIAISLVRWFGNSARTSRWAIALGALFVSIYSLLKILDGHDTQFLDFSFWIFFALILVLALDSVSISAIDKYFCFLLAYALASNAIEVFLFVAFGRLPALAFSGSYLVRFGGFLDDPNGFAAILFLLMGWSYMRFKGRTRFLVLAGIIISLLLTQSWTAIAFFLVVIFFWGLNILSRRPIFAILAACILPCLALLVVQWIRQLPGGLLWQILEDKQGTIEGHSFPFALWASKWPDWLMLGEWKYNHYESWWASAMINFGLLWFIAYLSLIVALLFFVWRAYARSTRQAKPVHAGLLVFGFYFLFGSLNLPLPIVFPINALFFLFFFVVAFRRIESDNCVTEAAHELPLAGLARPVSQ